jgi:hypothetical protein
VSVAERLLAGLGPALRRRGGRLLEPYVQALTSGVELVDQLVHGTSSRAPFRDLFDLATSPVPEWLGSATGTPVPGGLDLEQRRAFVRDRPAQRRGTPGALIAAVQQTLIGSQQVTLLERTPSPDHVTVQVFAAQTPDPDATRSAALSQKPVGLLLVLEVLTGASWEHMRDIHGPTWTDFDATFGTWADARNHLPEA